ncbi:MAG: prepilin-type N-terminal cleavage/methylation domain-containing protein [Candidatus Kaiserbacteria bacterium]|nr:prepilin-type N-terminal cleavage/methylation domain-containing protein [Candidatus Kaiserbacteria bacterium]
MTSFFRIAESLGKRKERGFTLIELLVVIAIIGLLSSVILASLNGARKKGRDARRLSDMKSLQTALELYYNDNNQYPAATTQANAATALTALAPSYISSIPDDPLGGAYHYVYKTTAGGTFYCLGTVIEGTAPASTCNTTSLGSSLTGVQYSVGP